MKLTNNTNFNIFSCLLLRLGRAIEISAVCAYTERERTTESMERRMGHSSLGNEIEKKNIAE